MRFEVSNHKWTALAEEGRGVAVLNDCKYGLNVKGRSLNLTLLKSSLAPDMTADLGRAALSPRPLLWNGSLLESSVVHEAYDLYAPTLPAKGATVFVQRRPGAADVSIHAPREGSDGAARRWRCH